MVSCYEEKVYVTNFLLNDILQLNIDISQILCSDRYRLVFKDKILEIEDAFFSKFRNGDYLSPKNIPKDLLWFDFPWYEMQIPMIYGKNQLIVRDDYIYCGLDIFASSFFMLSRWEEMFLPKDRFGRCDENEMFVVKHGIYNKPIVNEYIELLRELLQYIGVDVKELDRKFHPFITHDVDDLFRYVSVKNLCKNLAGDILHRKNLNEFFRTCKNYIRFRGGKIKDPFDTFDELMDLGDEYGYKDAFYFMPSYHSEHDARYDIRDKKIRCIIDNIVARGHEVGIHSSKNTFHNPDQFVKEIDRLKSICSLVRGGRQHYLLYDLPKTLGIWEKCGLDYDAGIGFAFRGGFRCGICYPYPFFDVLKREKMNLIVRPLVVMEAAVLRDHKDIQLVKEEIYTLVDVVKRFRGELVFLWHNDNFYRTSNSPYMGIYRDVVAYMFKK